MNSRSGKHNIFCRWRKIVVLATCLGPASSLRAEDAKPPAKPQPDVLIFADGEKLIGHLEKSTGGSLVFKSDMAGEVTADWSEVKEFHSSSQFAVIEKNVKLRNKEDAVTVPRGTLSMTDEKMEVTPEPPASAKTIPVPDAAYVVDNATFQKNALDHTGIFENWKGDITAGASLVEATQKSRSFTGVASLVRAVPAETWIDLRNRTSVNFAASYGRVAQPNTPAVKTNIIHGDVERDEYLTSRVYAFGTGAWDHNFSQGLDLQQTYGGGFGWTLIKTDNEQLDLKAGLSYIRQQFTGGSNRNVFGSIFGQSYLHKFPRSVVLTQSVTILPGWTNLDAYSVLGNVALSLPLYKRFNITFGTIDTFLNNPPLGFKKNSYQFIAGFTYTMP